MVNLREYFLETIAENRRDASRENLLAALDAGGLSEAEIVANAMSVIFAGHETSTGAIGNVVLGLLRELAIDPAELRYREHISLRAPLMLPVNPNARAAVGWS
jgi:cytochrome P450